MKLLAEFQSQAGWRDRKFSSGWG